MEIDPILLLQAAAAFVLPFVVTVLKAAIPNLGGRNALIANVLLNFLAGIGGAAALGAPMLPAAAVGVGGGLAGSKAVDVAKNGTDPDVIPRR